MQKVGVGLTAFGVSLTFLGVILFFDAGLIAIGNILFLAGVALIIGLQKTAVFFARKDKIKGTVCFFIGFLFVFFRWSIIGIIIEALGFINLFGDFFPTVIGFLRRLPVIGTLLNLPGIRQATNFIGGAPPKYPV
ncbi:Golgi Transport [Mycoemilia scoparia]|uniref:Golgi Transport n=1 Tax=Mycoemilia scoparia TaxID=417184 RepID=A0A9W7ZS37_9FUNG|nr:Golgi Transport [Mycoemilia scoparia]